MASLKSAIIIPARRGGYNKNVWLIHQKPMISYLLDTLKELQKRSDIRVIVSTDSSEVQEIVDSYDEERLDAAKRIKWVERPTALAGNTVRTDDVMIQVYLDHCRYADILILAQPTNPFISYRSIWRLIECLEESEKWMSAQTICRVPHNMHWMNQREVIAADKEIDFRWREERLSCHQKQMKPPIFMYGGLLAVRAEALIDQNTVFAAPSKGIEVLRYRTLDIDNVTDLSYAEALVSSGLIHTEAMPITGDI